MTRGRFGLLVLAVVASGWLVAPVGGQDSTTLLTQFLTDLRAGVVGTSQSLSVSVANGTAAAPGLRFRNDPDTGLFKDATGNILRVSVGGAQVAQFDDNPGFAMVSTGRIGWTDTFVCRGAASVIGIGGCTTSFPALTRTLTGLQVTLGDGTGGGKFGFGNQAATVDGATTFAATSSYVTVACTGAETINTITGGFAGMMLYLEHTDTECTLADDDAATAADAIDLTGAATNDVGAVAKVIGLIYNGSHWLQVFESDN